MKSYGVLKLLTGVLPVAAALGMTLVFLQNYTYNTQLRSYDFSADALSDGVFDYPEVSVEVCTRGGDSGSWMKDAEYDEDGNITANPYVGTIYEVVVTNKTSDTLSDWEMTLFMPEDLKLNNSWNGELEIHQTTTGTEIVQAVDLAEYSSYDLILEHYIDSVGPMVPMKGGDYFIYHPDLAMTEMPIAPTDPDSDKPSAVRIGFITYIENQPLDYVADFSKGQIRFHLKTSVFKNPLFWASCGVCIAWIVCALSLIIVRVNVKRLMEQNKRDEQIIEQTMHTFVNFIEAKDPSTMGHSLRVAQYSRLLAECMGFSEDECKRIYYIALMHDCGKIYIPDEILTKPARLTDEEYAIMKKHTTFGNEILRDFTSIEDIQLGAMYHHERYDGKGYPSGIAGEEIPLISRIICVSDAFDAMNSKRCYRNNLTHEVIMSELEKNKGTQFDPVVVGHLIKLIEDGKVKLN